MRVSLRPTIPLSVSFAVLVLLAAGLSLVGLAGTPSPAAAAGLEASQIDDFLVLHGSPMAGTGATFVAEGQQYGVDPAFLVAIAGAETSFGQFLYSQDGDQCAFNAFNWFYGATWPQSDFGSWDEAIARVAEGLSGTLYYGAGLYSVEAIAPRYCPDGTAAWIANVTAFMVQLGGDPADTRLAGADPSTAPTTLPGLVGLDGSIKLSGGPLVVGRDATAHFTIVNHGAAPVQLDGVRLSLSGPAGAAVALVSDQPVMLTPGQPLDIAASWPLDTVGAWHGWIEVVQNGQRSLVGDRQSLAFRVRLPRELLMRRWIMAEVGLSTSR